MCFTVHRSNKYQFYSLWFDPIDSWSTGRDIDWQTFCWDTRNRNKVLLCLEHFYRMNHTFLFQSRCVFELLWLRYVYYCNQSFPRKWYSPILDKYRIMAVLKVETDIITCITVSPIGWAVIPVIMHIETLKMD